MRRFRDRWPQSRTCAPSCDSANREKGELLVQPVAQVCNLRERNRLKTCSTEDEKKGVKGHKERGQEPFKKKGKERGEEPFSQQKGANSHPKWTVALVEYLWWRRTVEAFPWALVQPVAQVCNLCETNRLNTCFTQDGSRPFGYRGNCRERARWRGRW